MTPEDLHKRFENILEEFAANKSKDHLIENMEQVVSDVIESVLPDRKPLKGLPNDLGLVHIGHNRAIDTVRSNKGKLGL
jgi:hypothetical protein